MKLCILYEQVVGHWETFYHPGHIDPKYRKKKKKQRLSFRNDISDNDTKKKSKKKSKK